MGELGEYPTQEQINVLRIRDTVSYINLLYTDYFVVSCFT